MGFFSPFYKYAESNLNEKKECYQPFFVTAKLSDVVTLTEEFLKQEKFTKLIRRDDFNELFAVKGIYEVTFHFVQAEHGQIKIVISVYASDKIILPRSYLKEINSKAYDFFQNRSNKN